MKHYKLVNAVIGATAAIIGFAAPASAVVVSGVASGGGMVTDGGTFVILPPTTPTIAINAFNTQNVYALNERQGVTLASDTSVNTSIQGNGTGTTTIAAGTKVNSTLLFIDPIGPEMTASGTVTFTGTVLGFYWRTATLRQTLGLVETTALFGLPGVTYGALGGLEVGDILTFSGNTVTYSFASPLATTDMVRIITAIPEPESWALLIAGFGLIGAVRRRQRVVLA